MTGKRSASWSGRSGVTVSRRGHRGQRTIPTDTEAATIQVRERVKFAAAGERMRNAEAFEAQRAVDAAVEIANARLLEQLDPAEVARLARRR